MLGCEESYESAGYWADHADVAGGRGDVGAGEFGG